jgi:hypothetical protein
MNTHAKCVDPSCPEREIEKSVITGQVIGFGVAKDRVTCPSCGQLMQTTRTVAGDPKRMANNRRSDRKRQPTRRTARRNARLAPNRRSTGPR